MTGAALRVERLTRRFAGANALDEITLDVAPGECLAVLGASGCGKSTLLRLVAGLDRPDGGRIALDGRVVAGEDEFVPPEGRSVGVVFQSYALWPHLDVAAHARFPLAAAGVRGAESERRVAEALALVGLESLASRRPAELSGGQRQRVALARCLAQRARLILMDEPLANLDPHLRGTMEREIDRVRRESGATVLYVTHDQREAMALADRIAVLDRGRLLQLATPSTLYREPADRRVAAFVGEGRLVPADASGASRHRGDGRGSTRNVSVGGRAFAARATGSPDPAFEASGPVELLVRPEHVRVRSGAAGEDELPARVLGCVFRGDHVALELAIEGVGTLEARVAEPFEPGTPVALTLDDAWIVPGGPDGATGAPAPGVP